MNKKYIRILAEMAIILSAVGMMTGCVNKRTEDASSSQAEIIITTDKETTIDETMTDEIITDSSSNVENSSSLNESLLNDSSVCGSDSSEVNDSSSIDDTQNNTEVEQTEVIYAETNSNQSDFEVTTPEIGVKTEYEIDVAVTDVVLMTDEQPEPKLCEAVTENEYSVVATDYTPYDLYNQGRLYWGNYQYTWYSERVLPGYGLDIEGRYTDADGFVCDGEGYICVAASSLNKGTIVDTPFGREGKVYDCGCDYGVIDVYTNW